MSWQFWRRWRDKPRPSVEATLASISADAKLRAAQDCRPGIENLAGRLAELRRTNHLAERVWASFRGAR